MTQHQKQQKKKEGTGHSVRVDVPPTYFHNEKEKKRRKKKKEEELPRRCEGPESKRSHCIRVRGSQHFELQWRRPFFFFFFYPAPPRAPFF